MDSESGLKGKFVVGYIGTHGLAHALDRVLDAAARAAAPRYSRDESAASVLNVLQRCGGNID